MNIKKRIKKAIKCVLFFQKDRIGAFVGYFAHCKQITIHAAII